MTLFLRRSLFAFVLGAALATSVFLGRNAFATTETIDACFKPSNGTLYLLGGSSGRDECQPGDIPISWNTSGVNGQDGVSVTSDALASGDANCPNGGSKFTAVSGVTYACNGSNGSNGVNGQDGQDGADGAPVTSQALAPGDDPACPNGGSKFTSASDVTYACNGADGEDGADGQDGVDGEDFVGTFTSPNGRFKLTVDDAGARLEGAVPNIGGLFKLIVDNTGARMEGIGPNSLSRAQVTGNSAQIQTTGSFSASAAQTSIGGGQQVFLSSPQILLNGNQCGVLRSNDVALGPGGAAILVNPGGSPTVRIAGACTP